MQFAKSALYFLLAGLCEIGGGYLIWLWLWERKPVGFALLGAVVLILYGIIPTLQLVHFVRVYAAYGGVFIVLSILWGWKVDGVTPDRFDLVGGATHALRRFLHHVLAEKLIQAVPLYRDFTRQYLTVLAPPEC